MSSTSALSINKSPDLQLLERVAETRLRESGYRPLGNLICTNESGVVTIRGCVPSFYLKQLAQTLVGGVDAVRRIENHVEVVEQNQ